MLSYPIFNPGILRQQCQEDVCIVMRLFARVGYLIRASKMTDSLKL